MYQYKRAHAQRCVPRTSIRLSRWQTVYYALCRCDWKLAWDALMNEGYRLITIRSPEELTTIFPVEIRRVSRRCFYDETNGYHENESLYGARR